MQTRYGEIPADKSIELFRGPRYIDRVPKIKDELYKTVARHLGNQCESVAALEQWDNLWNAYKQDGGDGIEKYVEKIIELPETVEKE